MQGLYGAKPTQEIRSTVDEAGYTAPTQQHDLDSTDQAYIRLEVSIYLSGMYL